MDENKRFELLDECVLDCETGEQLDLYNCCILLNELDNEIDKCYDVIEELSNKEDYENKKLNDRINYLEEIQRNM